LHKERSERGARHLRGVEEVRFVKKQNRNSFKSESASSNMGSVRLGDLKKIYIEGSHLLSRHLQRQAAPPE
jgi:hypothetical protein